MDVTKHIYISGKVQNVGFRYFMKKNADKFAVTGWAKNLSDGRVEAVFQGEDEQVEKMLDKVSEGPPPSEVEHVEQEDLTGEEEIFTRFDVRH